MNIYDKFTYFYTKGNWPQYSEKMATLLPAVFEKFNLKPKTILDIACGDGAFVVAMAKLGYQTVGVDQSLKQIKFAKERAKREKVKTEFFIQDIRSLSFKNKFDLLTCWYDSLNYILELNELERTFLGVTRALKKGGVFIFDMNTVFGLAVNWHKHPAHVYQDEENRFLIGSHPFPFDFEKNIAIMRITGFLKKGNSWQRMDEEHKEKGYTIEEIKNCLKKATLEELACFGSLEQMTELKADSPRVWFVARK